jgi:transposase-like protein
MGLGETLMKLVVKVGDAVTLARRFRESPALAMNEVVVHVRNVFKETLEQVMHAELELHLAESGDAENKRNGYRSRTFGVKGLGTVTVRVPRDRKGTFESRVVPSARRYDAAIERDLAVLHLAGISTRMLSILSKRVLGVKVSAQEVSNSLETIIPSAKSFLERPLSGRVWRYLYVDGTFFSVRRRTVAKEPTLVVLGVDEGGFKSVLSMVQGDKDSKTAWEMVFRDLKARGLDGAQVQLGIMDGLPGLPAAFLEAFPNARVARCWVHKAANVMPRVPVRYQAELKADWDRVQYADDKASARAAFQSLSARWGKECHEAVECMERDIEELLVHYEFPKAHWDALRTTNPIERVNKEFKRRSKAMEQMGPDGLRALLAFTALKLEFGWMQTSIAASNLQYLVYRKKREARLEEITKGLLN